MPSFADTKHRVWRVSLDVTAIRRVRQALDVDLLEVIEGGRQSRLLARLIEDPVLLCDLLFVLLEDECRAQGVSDEEFGRGLSSGALDDAVDALLQALVDFSRAPRRPLLSAGLKKLRELEQRATEAAIRKLESPEFEAQVERALDFGSASTASPAGSDSTPDP